MKSEKLKIGRHTMMFADFCRGRRTQFRLPALSETLTQRHSMFGFFNSSKDKKNTRRCLFVSHKSRRSLACNPTKSECNHFCKEIYVINPKNTLDEHTPAAITCSLGEITYQFFGLDKKKTAVWLSFFGADVHKGFN